MALIAPGWKIPAEETMLIVGRTNIPYRPSTAATSPLVPAQPFPHDPALPALLRRMAKASRDGAACELVVLPSPDMKATTHYFDYARHTGLPKQMNVEVAPPDGVLKLTLCINVSGHNGPALCDEWAASNRYNVRVTLPADPARPGDRPVVLEMKDIERNQPTQLEYATTIDIAVPTSRWKFGPIIVEAWPTGTSPAGYSEGRTYAIHPPGRHFDPQTAAKKPDGIDEEFWGIR
jgi:hypothetical protein